MATERTDFVGLTHLGSRGTKYVLDRPTPEVLECFKNRYPDRRYTVRFEQVGEFTSLCPKTGQPDYGTVIILYEPQEWCIESKSLKLYLMSFRNYGGFGEDLVNRICDDLFQKAKPRWMRVIGKFRPRGGISLEVRTSCSS